MDVNVSSHHAEVSSRLHDASKTKVGRLSRILGDLDRAEVHFSEEQNPRIRDREICEVTVNGAGAAMHSKAAAPDSMAALDVAVDKLERQVRKLKTKRARH